RLAYFLIVTGSSLAMAHMPASGLLQHRTRDLSGSLGAKGCQYHIGKTFAHHGSSGPGVAKPPDGEALGRFESGDARHVDSVPLPDGCHHSPFRGASHRFVMLIPCRLDPMSSCRSAAIGAVSAPWSH